MATLAAFRVQFPEFARAGAPNSDGFLQAYLDAATLEIDATIWLSMTDQGIYYLAAHKLAVSPFGNAAKLVAKDGTTTYGKQWDEMCTKVASGVARVT